MASARKNKLRVAILGGVALLISACTGSTTIDQTAAPAATESAVATVAPVEPTAVPPAPTAAPAPTTPTEPTEAPAPAAEPATPKLPLEDFRSDALLGLSNDASYAYAGTNSAWNNPSACNGPSTESVAVVAVDAAVEGDFTPRAAGVEQAGDVREMIFGATSKVAMTSSCGESSTDAEIWMHTATVTTDGSFTDVVGPLRVQAAENETNVRLLRWIDDDTVEVNVTIEVDPDDFESWLIERRHITVSTGVATVVEQSSFYDEDAFFGPVEVTTSDGVTYREIADPSERVGCEGFGIARTIEVDDGSGPRLALGADGPVYSNVGDLHIASTGHVAWTSGCEGFTSGYVAKIRADGSITDAHLIEQPPGDPGSFTDFLFYRLSNDGALIALGQTTDNNGQLVELVAHRFDLATDPHFVNTADPAVDIDAEPLLVAANGVNTWHVGETLGAVRACGGKTLYGRIEAGFVRAFDANTELDAIVDVDVGETISESYDSGDFVSRVVVFSTVCPGDYDGRRLWFGYESDTVNWGLSLQRADMEEVKEVLGVREQFQPGSQFAEKVFVEVVLFDDTTTEVELIAVPFEG